MKHPDAEVQEWAHMQVEWAGDDLRHEDSKLDEDQLKRETKALTNAAPEQ